METSEFKPRISENHHEKTSENDSLEGRRAFLESMQEAVYIVKVSLERPLAADDPLHEVGSRTLQCLGQNYQQALELACEKLYAYKFSEVPFCWVRMYEEAQLHAIVAIWSDAVTDEDVPCCMDNNRKLNLKSTRSIDAVLTAIVQRLDLALIKTQGLGRKALINKALRILDVDSASSTPSDECDIHILDGYSRAFDQDNSDLDEDEAEATKKHYEKQCAALSNGLLQADNLARQHAAKTWAKQRLSAPRLPATFPYRLTLEPVQSRVTKVLTGRDKAALTEQFQKHRCTSYLPVLIPQGVSDWPAISTWSDPNYWLEQTLDGRRLVPVEVGSKYTDEGWGQKILDIRHFISKHLCGVNQETSNVEYDAKDEQSTSKGYLAQHQFFEQMPQFYKDIRVPDFCYFNPTSTTLDHQMDRSGMADLKRKRSGSREETGAANRQYGSTIASPQTSIQDSLASSAAPNHDLRSNSNMEACGARDKHAVEYDYESPCEREEDSDEPSEININIWLGPADTVSPAHTDPHHNILAQVMGRKYVRLYAPSETTSLYPMTNRAQGVYKNTEHAQQTESLSMLHKATREIIDSQQSSGQGSRDNEANVARTKDQVDMSNTSQVDVGLEVHWACQSDAQNSQRLTQREEQLTRYPKLAQASFQECILAPGDCLFIPRGWWHYVQSLSVSASVSFWWD